MAVSKVILNGTTLIDTTDKTVTDSSMLNGITALDSAGVSITGNIATKSSSNMTVSGATVTAPAGYYATNASKTVASGSATTPTTTITVNPSISVSNSGLITATASASQSITPTISSGYVSSGTAGTITVSGSNTSQLTVYAGANHSDAYQVTITLTNPEYAQYASDCIVSELYSNHKDGPGNYDDLSSLGTIPNGLGTITVSIATSSYGVLVEPQGSWSIGYSDSDISVTGDVVYVGRGSDNGSSAFQVTGNGTITIDGIDYSD